MAVVVFNTDYRQHFQNRCRFRPVGLNASSLSGRIHLTREHLVRRLTAIFAADVAGYSRLTGSVRKAGNRIRIAGQLIDAETGAHLWVDRFDGALEDLFDLQDHVTSSVVGAIAPKLQSKDIKRATRKPTENLDAYDYYLRGLAKARCWNREANSDALQLFCKAIELDPRLACAYGMAA